MKNKFSKVLGVVLTLAVLTSLLTVAAPATPAAAGTLAYTTESLAGATTANFTDFAVSADGNTIYGVAGSGKIYKSTNQGTSWTTTTITGAPLLTRVAVAPDDANIVVAASNAGIVLVCTNGVVSGDANSWSVATGNNSVVAVSDLAISPAVSGVRQVTLVGATAAPVPTVQSLNLGGTVATWTLLNDGGNNVIGTAATTRAVAAKFSPNFVADRLLVVVTNDSAAGTYMNLFRFTTNTAGLWNAAGGFTDFTGATASTGRINALAEPVISADLSLAPTYSGTDSASRNAFVAINSAFTAGGVWQIKDAVTKKISDDVQMQSVAFNGTNLVAGRADNNVTYRSSDMLATTPTLTSTTQFQRPSGGIGATANMTLVAWAGTNAVAATWGNESAFSVSKDNGANYQDISLWNTSASTNITDLAVAPDASKIYYVTTGNGNDTDINVWAKTGSGTSAVNERLMSIIAPASARFSLRVAPENKQVIYLVQIGSPNIYFTDDGGDKNWVIRVANDNVIDLAVESAQVVYYTYGGNVRKSVNGGFMWSDPATVISSLGFTPVNISSLGKDLLILGGNGKVAYSTNGGTSFSSITLTGGGNLVATAGNLSSGSFVYAAAGAGNTLGAGLIQIYRYKIGSVAPDNVWKSISASAAATATFTGLKLVGGNSGILYAHSQDAAGIGSSLWRSMNPAEAGETSVVFSTLLAGATLATSPDFNLPNTRTSNLQISTVSGVNTIWGADADLVVSEESGDSATSINDEVYSFADTLAVAPTTTSPLEAAIIQMNPVAGGSFSTALSWNRPSLATAYQVQLAFDKDFKQPAAADAFPAPADPAISPVSVVLVAGALNPGTTYYWRIRATTPLISPWSTTVSFSTASLAAPFALAGPAVGATDVPVQPVLSWSAYTGSLWYEVTVSEDPSFAIPEFSHNVKGNLFYGITADEALKNSTTYYWRVRGVTAEPFVKGTAVVTPSGPWATGAFTTVAAAVKAEPPVIVIEKPAPPAEIKTITIEKEVPVPQPIPNWMLMTIIIIGAVLVIALIVLIVRTRRVA